MKHTYFSLPKLTVFMVLMLLLVVILPTQAQVITAAAYERKADEALQKHDYNTALAHLQTILTDDPKRTDLYFKTAQAASQLKIYGLAETLLEKIVDKDLQRAYPSLDFDLATVKFGLGKYEEAESLFTRYLANNSTGEQGAAAQWGIQNCQFAKTALLDSNKVNILHLDDKTNSAYADLAPFALDKFLYYTSAFKPTTALGTTDAPSVMRIYVAENPQTKKGAVVPQIADSATVNSANAAFTPDGKRMYFNLCEKTDTNTYICQLYYRDKKYDGAWSSPTRLPDAVNLKGYTASQPTVEHRAASNDDVIYFSSNRPGGKGGMDIWQTVVKSNVFSTPMPVADINTVKDDITPYFYHGANLLYFSSNGRLGMGGFDIYRAHKNNNAFEVIDNVGAPINGSYDDTYYNFHQTTGKSYFVSNRPGGMCDAPQKNCICEDIYNYDLRIDLNAVTLLGLNKLELAGTTVSLYDLTTGRIVTTIFNELGANFNFQSLSFDHEYRLIATRSNYTSDTVSFNTRSIYQPTVIKKELQLNPDLKFKVYVFDALNRQPLNGATVTLATASGKMIQSNTLQGNVFSYSPLDFSTRYYVRGIKNTYSADSNYFSTEGYTTSKFEYTDSLFLSPFTGLPVVLYFDNDYPDPRTRATRTVLTYDETVEAYLAKQNEFLAAFNKTAKNAPGEETTQDVANFFASEVQLGYSKLMEFSALLSGYLSQGHSLEVVLEGYASPLAKNDYNRNLTARRISSVINHFYDYNGGLFKQYLSNGQLRIRVDPFGEERANQNISDDERNRKSSVYSIGASRERKVMIKEINRLEAAKALDLKVYAYELQEYLGGRRAAEMMFNAGVGRDNGLVSKGDVNGSSNDKRGSRRNSRNNGANGVNGAANGQSNGASDMLLSGISSPNSSNAAVATSSKQNWEIVAIDANTGEVIRSAKVLVAANGNALKTRSRRRGKYVTSVTSGSRYEATISAAGYSQANANNDLSSSMQVESLNSDTVLLQPFARLPLPLYFDNDRPNGGSMSVTTSSDYEQTYLDYYRQKSNFSRVANNLNGGNGGSMETFFDGEVRLGFEHLAAYKQTLRNYLSKGFDMEIVLQGYASPLAELDYNQKLAARRVQSVVNYFNSSLSRYVKTGRLKITVEAVGESNSSASDDAKNPNSIFSLEASRERRVEVKDIRILGKR